MMKRIAGLDSFKAIACLMVIIIHVTATPVTVLEGGAAGFVLTVLNRFAKPSVPMFIFASGFALYYRYGGHIAASDKAGASGASKVSGNSGALAAGGEFSYPDFLWHRAGKILVPYTVWCAVYYAWFIYFGIYDFNIAFFLQNLISGKMMYHLYFVTAIVQYYLLFGVLRVLTEKCSAWLAVPAAFAVNIAEVCLIPDWYYGRCFLTYITVFLLGTYAAKHIDKVQKTAAGGARLALLGAAALLSGIIYTMQFTRDMAWERGIFDDDKIVFTVFSIFATLFMYGLCVLLAEKAGGGCNISAKIEFVLGQIGKGSFYIFLSHPLFMLIAGSICGAFGITGVLKGMALALVLIFAFCIPLSIAYANLRGRRHKNRV